MFIKCLLTGHDWQRLRNEDNEPYLECRRCGMDGDLTEAFYGTDSRRGFGGSGGGVDGGFG